MKKLLLFFALTVCMSCLKLKIPDTAPMAWRIDNRTEQMLILKAPYYYSKEHSVNSEPFSHVDLEYRTFELLPRTGKVICHGVTPVGNKRFDYYFTECAKEFGNDVSWQIFSEYGDLLKTWKYSERELPGQRFFNVFEWPRDYGAWECRYFSVMPEYLQQTNQ